MKLFLSTFFVFVGLCLGFVECGPTLNNVLATRHVNGGGDACALPQTDYNVRFPFALGSLPELDYLKFRPGEQICLSVF
jgi:hypothetical protein